MHNEAQAAQKAADAERDRQASQYTTDREAMMRKIEDDRNRELAERQEQANSEMHDNLYRTTAIESAMTAFEVTAAQLRQTVRQCFADVKQQHTNLLQTILSGQAPDTVTLACIAAALGKDEQSVCTDLENALAENLERDQPADASVRVNYVEQLKARRARAKQETAEREHEHSMWAYLPDPVPEATMVGAVSPPAPAAPPTQDIGGRGVRLGVLDGQEVVVGVSKLG